MLHHAKIFIAALGLAALMIIGFAQTDIAESTASSGGTGLEPSLSYPHATDHVLIKLAGTSEASSKANGYEHIFGDWYQAPVKSHENVKIAMDRLSTSTQVVMVQPDYVVGIGPWRIQPQNAASENRNPDRLDFSPNDPLYPNQWHFPAIQAPAAWESSQGEGVIVAIVDSGVAKGTDLACRTFVHEYNAITDQTGPGVADDDFGHGTHVAGTVAQCTNNELGVAGLAFEASLMPIKALDNRGNGSTSTIAKGIDWARTHDADVINLSLAGRCNGQIWPNCSFPIVNDAIAAAANEDIFIAAAAGNWGDSTVGTPANHPDAVAVAAVLTNLERASYSNQGTALSVSAPGGDLNQDQDNDGNGDGVLQQSRYNGVWGYWYSDGTSMAAPHVAGAAAMLRALFPHATRQEIQSVLESTALDKGDPGFDMQYGYGVIQVADAITALGQLYPTPTPTQPITHSDTNADSHSHTHANPFTDALANTSTSS